MKTKIAGILIALLMVACPVPTSAQHHGYGGHGWHGGHGHGWYGGGLYIGLGWPWLLIEPPYPYPYPYPYPSYPVYPPAVVEGPHVYIQRPPIAAPPEEPAYWYYCSDSRAYYPTVRSCRSEWIKVVPTD